VLIFLLRRLAAATIMLAVAGTVVFSLIHILPGDPVLVILGDQAASDPKVVESMRAKLHLDLPIPIQYADWLWALGHLDLGSSLQTGVAVSTELGRRVPRSIELIVAGLLLATLMGIPLGIVGAQKRNAPAGWASSVIAALGFSSPIFVTGIVLIITLSLWIRWLPSSGYVAFAENPIVHLHYLILPALTLALNFMGVVIRMTRASLLDVLGRDYMRTARAKGMPEHVVTYRHGLRNALIPVIAVIGVRAGNLLGGTVILESLFNWPGLSSLLVRACYDRDYPMIQGALLAIFTLFVGISIVVDLAQAAVDPRLRRS
jgi:peptide/nickel transport system permease protein